jgi:hypothetical protein
MTTDLLYSIDEPSKPSFDHVSIDSSLKFVQFTLASKNLIIDSLQRKRFSTFHEICEAHGNLRPLLSSHKRSIDSNDIMHTQERWEKLQKNLKFIEIIDRIGLSPSSDLKQGEVLPIENW